MPLTNSQYNALMRVYEEKRAKSRDLANLHYERACQKVPELASIDASISSASLDQAKKLLAGDDTALASLKEDIRSLSDRRRRLLSDAGFPEDYLEQHFECPDCQDTGYVGTKKCHCFLQQEIRLLYSSSHLDQILAEENFSHLSYDVYDEEQKQIMPEIIRTCHQFVNGFDQEFKNILFYGSVGTGKTFLSNCIAKELLDTGHSVIYFTSFQLFELLSIGAPADKWNLHQQYEALLDSDLLILDDCGTEVSNTFTVSRLFQLLNERALLRKSTIISTNLSIREFRDVYSERIFSRITSSYTLLKLTGSDIRIRRKINRTL